LKKGHNEVVCTQREVGLQRDERLIEEEELPQQKGCPSLDESDII
jgi:hypothetical protein